MRISEEARVAWEAGVAGEPVAQRAAGDGGEPETLLRDTSIEVLGPPSAWEAVVAAELAARGVEEEAALGASSSSNWLLESQSAADTVAAIRRVSKTARANFNREKLRDLLSGGDIKKVLVIIDRCALCAQRLAVVHLHSLVFGCFLGAGMSTILALGGLEHRTNGFCRSS